MEEERTKILLQMKELEKYGIFYPHSYIDKPAKDLIVIRDLLVKEREYQSFKSDFLSILRKSFEASKSFFPSEMLEKLETDPDFRFLF